MKKYVPSLFLLTLAFLSACGSSSDDDEKIFADAYLQFYNGSVNSAATYIAETDGGTLGVASYGDATSLIVSEGGDVELEFFRVDADDQAITLEETTVNLNDGEKVLMILSGDYQNPSFLEHRITREDLVDHFRLFATSVADNEQSYDLYMSQAGVPFSDASLLTTIGYQQVEEVTYWEPDTESEDFDEGEYVIYLTEPGSDMPFFESPTIPFIYNTEHVLALRSTSGAIKDNLVIDLIINSSIVISYSDENASAQYRVYNSLDGSESVSLTLDNNGTSSKSIGINANSMSDFKVVDFGDYRLSANVMSEEGASFNNRLMTLNQGQSKAILLYKDQDGVLTSMSFEESTLPQVFDHHIQIANLNPDFLDIDFYFVRKDETIETAEYKISGLDYAENRSITLPSDCYELIAVYDDNNDTQVLLDRTELMGINQEVNYIVTVEKTADSATGYKISVLY